MNAQAERPLRRDYAATLDAFAALPTTEQDALLHDLTRALLRAGLRQNATPTRTDYPRPALRVVQGR